MKKILLVTLIGLLAIVNGMAQIPQVIAHRGFWKSEGAAQNSMAALLSAMNEQFYGVECDAQLTADSVFIIYHDATVDGTPVEQLSWKTLQNHTLANGEHIPTVKQYLVDYKQNDPSRSRLYFEVKPQSQKELRDLAIRQTIGLVKKYQLADRVAFISFDLNVCSALAKAFPNTPVFYLGGDKSPKMLTSLGIDGIDYQHQVLRTHPEWVRDAHQLGMKVIAWTVNDQPTTLEMMRLGVDAITTDEPMLVQGWVSGDPVYRVMSFNVRMSANAAYDGDNAWPNRKDAVVRMIQTENPDMLGVQEMLPDQQQFLRAALSATYDMVGVGRDNGTDEGECMAVFYRKDKFKLLDGKTFWLSETPDKVSMGWDAACKRTVTVAHLQDLSNKKEFYYLNTHLDHVGKVARRESILLLKHLIDSLVPKGVPVVLGGDMNSSLSDSIFIPLIGNKGFMKSAREQTLQTDHSITFTGYDKEPHTCIDHLFVNDYFKVLTFKTLKQDYGVPFISDHYPVMIEVVGGRR